MTARSPYDEMKSALEAIRSAESNQKPVRYAPWVLGLMLVIFLRDRVPTDAGDWIKAVIAVAILPFLGRLALKQLERQRMRGEDALERLLQGGRSIQDWTKLQSSSPRYRGMRLPDRVQRAVINAAMVQQKRDEEKRGRALREHAKGEPVLSRG